MPLKANDFYQDFRSHYTYTMDFLKSEGSHKNSLPNKQIVSFPKGEMSLLCSGSLLLFLSAPPLVRMGCTILTQTARFLSLDSLSLIISWSIQYMTFQNEKLLQSCMGQLMTWARLKKISDAAIISYIRGMIRRNGGAGLNKFCSTVVQFHLLLLLVVNR